MKKILSYILGVLVLCGLLALTSSHLEKAQGFSKNNTLTLYNWGDYIDPDLLKKFEKESGYKVSYETFDSNEAMFTKIKQGGTQYDLAIPSEYMIEKMISAKMLKPLDQSKIKNLANINPQFLNQPFDPHNTFSVPYFWGTLGIVYNDEMISGSEIKTWDDLWSPKLQQNVMLVDSARDILGLSLVSMGHSMNSTNISQLEAAKNKLDQLTPNVKAVVADEIKMYMIQNEAAVAVTWSGEASEMLAGNSHLHYVVPNQGSNLWFDNLVIPKTAKNMEGAYAFINFMLEPENAAQNAEYVGYATPNTKAKALLPKSISSDQQFYPNQETMSHLEVFENLSPKMVGIYNDLFLEFKMYRK